MLPNNGGSPPRQAGRNAEVSRSGRKWRRPDWLNWEFALAVSLLPVVVAALIPIWMAIRQVDYTPGLNWISDAGGSVGSVLDSFGSYCKAAVGGLARAIRWFFEATWQIWWLGGWMQAIAASSAIQRALGHWFVRYSGAFAVLMYGALTMLLGVDRTPSMIAAIVVHALIILAALAIHAFLVHAKGSENHRK